MAPASIALWMALMAAALSALLLSPSVNAEQAATPGGTNQVATYVGEQVCARCHQPNNTQFSHTVHAKAFRLNPRNETERRVCEACHGPGSLHVETPTDHSTLIGFTKSWGTPLEVQNGQCMSCHEGGERLHWPGSAHARNLLGCSDCHNPMARFSATGLLARPSISETCQMCHKQQEAEFRRRSHMP